MNHTKLIHQFFDGGIEGADEESLFSALAGDRELRREFIEHLKISSFVQHDSARTGPPAEVSNAVFAAIGLPQPGAPFAANDESAWQKLGVLIQRMLPFLATVFVTAAVTSGVFLLTDRSPEAIDSAAPSVSMADAQSPNASLRSDLPGQTGRPPSGDSDGEPTGEATHATSSIVLPGGASVLSGTAAIPSRTMAPLGKQSESYTASQAIDAGSAVSTLTEGTVAGEEAARATNLPGAPVPQAIPGSGAATAFAQPFLRFTADDIPLSPLAFRSPDGVHSAGPENASPLVDMPSGLTAFTIANVIFQLRLVGFHGAYPNAGLEAPTEGVFRDMVVAGLYKISEQHAIGATYGREPIGRIYTRMVVDKNRTDVGSGEIGPDDMIAMEFRDYDMLDWGGLTWKMSHTNLGILRTFYPFTELTAAVSKYGPIGRAMLGVELYPSNASMLNVGVEVTSLAYTIEDKMYTSTKLGGSFGIALSF